MTSTRWAYWVALPLAVVVWAFIAVIAQTSLLPTPLAVLDAFWLALQSGELIHHLGVTLRRVIFSFVLAMLLGTLIGIWMGRSRLANALLDPLLVLFLNLPALVVITNSWKIAATVRKGSPSRTKLKLSSALPMDMSTRPATSSCAGFTCGPPVRSSTSSPAAR